MNLQASSLSLRIISAAIALLVLFLVNYFFQAAGVIAFGLLWCIGGAVEFSQIAFSPLSVSPYLRHWFLLVCILLMGLTLYSSGIAHTYWFVSVTIYLAGAIWFTRNSIENPKLLAFLGISSLGLYIVLLYQFFRFYC